MISEAKKKANKKYHDKTYKRFGADIKITDYKYLDSFCQKTGISKAQLIVAACRDYIERSGYTDYSDDSSDGEDRG